MITLAWKKSTSASTPGAFVCGIITSNCSPNSRLRRPTYRRTVDSATCSSLVNPLPDPVRGMALLAAHLSVPLQDLLDGGLDYHSD